jgi:CAAX prenyl protease-like protein
MGGFHSVAGWLFFNAAILPLVATSRYLTMFARTMPQREVSVRSNPAAAYLAPLIGIIATAMITRLFVYRFDVLYPLRVVAGAGILWFYWNRRSLRWNASWTPIMLGILAFGIWIILARDSTASARDSSIGGGLANLSAVNSLLWILFRLTGAILILPMAEELAFRGYLMRRLVSTKFESVASGHFTWLSFLGSSVLFGALHTEWWAGTLVGMIFAIAVYYRGSLLDAVIAHCVANGSVAAYVMATRHWFLWN